MKKLVSLATSRTFQILVSLTAALSLAGVILLNLAWFYDQSLQNRWIIFILSSAILFGFVLLANRFMIVPNVNRILTKEGLLFISLISILLVTISGLSAVYYWSVPVSHAVEICFDASANAPHINVQALYTPLSNRIHSPRSFGFTRYPIRVESGSCVTGNIVSLYTDRAQWWEVPGLTILLPATPPEGRFFVSINGSPAVVQLGDQAAEEFNNEVTYREGFEYGKRFTIAQNRIFFLGIKGIGILLSALYLSFFLFGLSELIINDPGHNGRKRIDNHEGIT